MLRQFSIAIFKFFLAGHGMSFRTGRYVSLAALVGTLVGLVTTAFYWLIQLAKIYVMEELAHHQFMSTLPSGEAVRTFWTWEMFLDWHRWLLVFLPAIGAVLGFFLIHRFARVEHARGTDSAVKAFHRGESISRGVIPVKSVASVLTVGFGGSAGYEGPVTLIGAACGSVVNRWFNLNARESRILMAAGLGAGIAALFRAPFAGALFGAEIFYSSSDLESDTIMPSVVASVMSYTVFACFNGWDPIFSMPHYSFENGLRLIPYFILAFIIAFAARFYISFFRATERWFSERSWPIWRRVAAGGLMTGVIGFFCPDILGSSYSIIQTSFTAGESEVFAQHGALTVLSFAGFFFIKAIATSCTVGSGGSGGVFAPALVCGGTVGAATGLLFVQILPASLGVHPGAFALVGMAAFLASSIRVPLTSVVMVAEISGNHELLLPTMWACGIAFWLNNGWSLYRSQVHSRDSSPLYVDYT